jgi:diguanylate cyclase (GGDEF)-like protein
MFFEEIIRLKRFYQVPLLLWVASTTLYVILILSETIYNDLVETFLHDHVSEMLWLLLLVPSIFFCYYVDLRAGIVIAFTSVIIQLITETLEFLNGGYVLHTHDVQVFLLVFLLQFLIVISVGLMTEKFKKLNQRLDHQSNLDDLSKLLNRRGFFQMASSIVYSSVESACFYIDLDDFKPINDAYGHKYGDMVIETVSKRILSCTRSRDIVARIGGDEFVCILVETNPEKAEKVASRMISVLSEPISIIGKQLNVSCSIGIAISPIHGETLDGLLTNADKAMYAAKNNGKNKYSFFNE